MTKDENKTLGKFETRLQGVEIACKEVRKEVVDLKKGQDIILTNHLPAIEKKIVDLKWIVMLGVGIIAILVTLFGSLIIISG